MLAAALGAAARAVAAGDDNAEQSCVLLELWTGFVCQASQEDAACLGPEPAAALVVMLAQAPDLAQQLLTPKVPVAVLSELLKTAAEGKVEGALLQILQYCSQQQQLHQVSSSLLSLVSAAPLPDTAEAAQARQQVIAQLLQQGCTPCTASAAALLHYLTQGGSRSSSAAKQQEQWQQLLAWLTSECRSAPVRAAAAGLMYELLALSQQQQLSALQSWQLYELLLSLQEEWKGPEHQALPAAAADALIQQQGQLPGGDATARVLQVWQHFAGRTGAAITELQSSSQQQVVCALVSSGAHDQALALVQQVPQHLGTLVEGWKQQQQEEQQQQVKDELLANTLQLAVQVGTLEAAAAAEHLLGLIQQQQHLQESSSGVLQVEVAEAVLQLLCQHGRVGPAGAWLLPMCKSPSAAAAFFSAAAKQPDAGQQEALKELRCVGGSMLPKELMMGGLDLLLESKDTVAVALIWEALQASHQGSACLLATLTSTHQQQLVELCCSSDHPASAASSFVPEQLAKEFMMCDTLPAESAARLMTAIARDREELQPCRAAVFLEVVQEQELVEAAANISTSSSSHRGRQANHASAELGTSPASVSDCVNTLRLVAQLCIRQLGGACSSSDVAEVEEAVDWVATLSPDILSPPAAGAALFAVWYGQQEQEKALISPVAAGVLGLSLYHAARKGSMLSAAGGWTAKPSMDSLVLDLALAAAAGAEQWDEGKGYLHSSAAITLTKNGHFLVIYYQICLAFA
jgi:hypothetical protein